MAQRLGNLLKRIVDGLPVPADHGEPQYGGAVFVERVHLGGGHVEFVLQAVQDAAYDAPLVFERAGLADQQPDLERADNHSWLAATRRLCGAERSAPAARKR